jgi:hypothetical protein
VSVLGSTGLENSTCGLKVTPTSLAPSEGVIPVIVNGLGCGRSTLRIRALWFPAASVALIVRE